MIKWNKHLRSDRTNGSYFLRLSFGEHRVQQISTRICVSRERFGKQFFSPMKTQPHRFTRVWRFVSNKLWRVQLRVENIECNTYQLTFKTGKEVLSKPFLSWLKITASPFHSSALLVFVSVVRQCFRFLM